MAFEVDAGAVGGIYIGLLPADTGYTWSCSVCTYVLVDDKEEFDLIIWIYDVVLFL